jgi:hypothetical protein
MPRNYTACTSDTIRIVCTDLGAEEVLGIGILAAATFICSRIYQPSMYILGHGHWFL